MPSYKIGQGLLAIMSKVDASLPKTDFKDAVFSEQANPLLF
jgi:hypothetical protein